MVIMNKKENEQLDFHYGGLYGGMSSVDFRLLLLVQGLYFVFVLLDDHCLIIILLCCVVVVSWKLQFLIVAEGEKKIMLTIVLPFCAEYNAAFY